MNVTTLNKANDLNKAIIDTNETLVKIKNEIKYIHEVKNMKDFDCIYTMGGILIPAIDCKEAFEILEKIYKAKLNELVQEFNNL